ncbi:hypothetical protein [Bacillus badius]|uniref:hypothetical protein n=1 Tax=Bacillus badius TaxID=1455 RepID=UPI0007B3D4C8|nr:hypothetical protein [Bacillus badius]KZR56951.1 hypothetical protein A3781_20435 [Bacillus badius]
MIPALNMLDERTAITFKELLEDTPFTEDDFYYTGNDFFPFLIWKGLLYYQFIGLNKEVLEMELPRLSKQYHHIQNLLKEKNFFLLLSTIVDKSILIRSYLKLFKEIPDQEKFDLFIKVYNRSEYHFDELDERFLEQLMKYRPSNSIYNPLSSFLEKEMIEVYRGVGKLSLPASKGFSWTLDKKVAEWFASRFSDGGAVYRACIRPDKIIAYIKERNEEEIILLPSFLENIAEINEKF